MATNKLNLAELNNKETNTSEDVQDVTEKFDPTGSARQEAREKVEKVIGILSRGGNATNSQVESALRGLLESNALLDNLVKMMLGDMFRLVQAIATREVNVFALEAKFKALLSSLEKKGVSSEEEIKEIYEKEVLPEVLEAYKKSTENSTENK